MGQSDPGTPDSAGHEPNSVLFGRYRVARELGRGGMGVVFLARDLEMDEMVAIKLVPDAVTHDGEAIAGLRKEVKRGMALNHDGVVRTHHFAKDHGGAAIVMEFVEGHTLTELKRQQPAECFDFHQIHGWLEQLCLVLDYAHGKGFIHRDLKPRNVMLTPGGKIKVADFGIAALISDSVSRHSMEGIISGTLCYMSPQQAEGKRPSVTDDIHAVGASLYELLTGKPPFFRGAPAALMHQLVNVIPPSMAERRAEFGVAGKQPIPPAWERVVAACLAKDPAERPQTAGEILARLNASVELPPSRPSRRGGALILGLLAFVGVAGAVYFTNRTNDAGGPESLRNQKSSPASIANPAKTVWDNGSVGRVAELVLPGNVLMKFCYCPPGSFTMGSPSEEMNREADEDQVPVKITKGFWLSQTELTQAQWEAVMGAGNNPSSSQERDRPVEQVSWNNAQEYLGKLTTTVELPSGWSFRLPTEAQWEYACRAGTQTVFTFGDRLSGDQANVSGKFPYGGAAISPDLGKTVPVGRYQPNAWGLYDIHGNVWEWCADVYGEKLPGGTDPTGPSPGDEVLRVIRGGSWVSAVQVCRAACRLKLEPDGPHADVGLRVAISQ